MPSVTINRVRYRQAVSFALGMTAVLSGLLLPGHASAQDHLLPVSAAALTQPHCSSCNTEAVWRASRPLVVRSQSNELPTASRHDPEQRLMKLRLEQHIQQSEANARFWASRLHEYRRLKYSEAVAGLAGHAELQMLAAHHQAEALRTELSLLNRGLLNRGLLHGDFARQ